MAKRNSGHLAEQAVRLGLLTDGQVREAFRAVDKSAGPEAFLRYCERHQYLTPWQSQKLLKGDSEGYFLGGYRLLYRIASGSFGRVFRAEDPRTKTVVAIKVLRKRWSEQKHTIELFEREGKVGLALRHPNIVSILDVSLDPKSRQYYIVMEFVEGGNLRDFLAIRQRLEPAEALRLMEDAVSALAYAYSMGITHRDIKPTNVLISSTGAAKLVDFGLADICASASELEDDTSIYRTVDYAGLEKATDVKRGDVRSDIYFLGCILYEMLTGRSALILTPDHRARMEKERFLNAPTLRADEVPNAPGVIRLVERMMALNPQQRFQTPSQLLEAIRGLRQGGDGTMMPGGDAQPVERSIFVVEKNRRLQEAFRDNFKKMGYRVYLAAECSVAMERFRNQPFDALVLDAGTAGVDGLRAFEDISNHAARKGQKLAGILILSQDQSSWTKLVPYNPRVAVMVRPLTLGQLIVKLRELVPLK
jgi:serine/threonine protein kinase